MAAPVERMLALYKWLAAARTQIEITDRRVDRPVCALYRLTGEEVGVVEEAG